MEKAIREAVQDLFKDPKMLELFKSTSWFSKGR